MKFEFGTYPNDSRPVFHSNGVGVLLATGADCPVTMLAASVLKEKFDAELLVEKIRLNPYWQVGEMDGSIYKLGHFPVDESNGEVDYRGLYVFNIGPVENDFKEEDFELFGSCPIYAICEAIVANGLYDSFSMFGDKFGVEVSDVEAAVKRSNEPLQGIIDQLKK